MTFQVVSFTSTLVSLLCEHVRLTIFRKLCSLCGLNRHCSLNYFLEKIKPVRLIGTVRLIISLRNSSLFTIFTERFGEKNLLEDKNQITLLI